MGRELPVLDGDEVLDGVASVLGEFGDAARGMPVDDPVPAHGVGTSAAGEFVAGVGVAGSPGLVVVLGLDGVPGRHPAGNARFAAAAEFLLIGGGWDPQRHHRLSARLEVVGDTLECSAGRVVVGEQVESGPGQTRCRRLTLVVA